MREALKWITDHGDAAKRRVKEALGQIDTRNEGKGGRP
jgi:hypothetical protein